MTDWHARHRMQRAVEARPCRAWVAARLVAAFATGPGGGPATARSRRAVRVSEWLLGVPAGTTRAALGDAPARANREDT